MQADSLPAEPVGKPKYTGVRSLSLLQGIFQTQESNICELVRKVQTTQKKMAKITLLMEEN